MAFPVTLDAFVMKFSLNLELLAFFLLNDLYSDVSAIDSYKGFVIILGVCQF